MVEAGGKRREGGGKGSWGQVKERRVEARKVRVAEWGVCSGKRVSGWGGRTSWVWRVCGVCWAT